MYYDVRGVSEEVQRVGRRTDVKPARRFSRLHASFWGLGVGFLYEVFCGREGWGWMGMSGGMWKGIVGLICGLEVWVVLLVGIVCVVWGGFSVVYIFRDIMINYVGLSLS